MKGATIQSGAFSRPAARFVAIGLFLMAFFTILWALWSFYGLPAVIAAALVVIFGVLAVGIWLIASETAAAPLVASLAAVATVCGTTAYGLYMLRVKRAISAALAESAAGATTSADKF